MQTKCWMNEPRLHCWCTVLGTKWRIKDFIPLCDVWLIERFPSFSFQFYCFTLLESINLFKVGLTIKCPPPSPLFLFCFLKPHHRTKWRSMPNLSKQIYFTNHFWPLVWLVDRSLRECVAVTVSVTVLAHFSNAKGVFWSVDSTQTISTFSELLE